jgi:putative membrane protein insertion efficiency factor
MANLLSQRRLRSGIRPETVRTEDVRSAQPGSAHADGPPTVVVPTTRLGRVVAAPIVAYRRWISPALPPTCRYFPSCSEYALTAVAVHGPLRGTWLAIRRLLRCHPFHPGGIDHVPPRHPTPDATDREH